MRSHHSLIHRLIAASSRTRHSVNVGGSRGLLARRSVFYTCPSSSPISRCFLAAVLGGLSCFKSANADFAKTSSGQASRIVCTKRTEVVRAADIFPQLNRRVEVTRQILAGNATGPPRVKLACEKKTSLCFEFSLCLFRACLDKCSVLIYLKVG